VRICPHCEIEIDGGTQFCPLCQNELRGDATPDIFPSPKTIRKGNILYKIQMFIIFLAAIISVSLDFMFEINGGYHWSIPVALGCVYVELSIIHLFKNFGKTYRFVNYLVVEASLLLIWIFHFIGENDLCMYLIIPIILTVLAVADLVFALVDKGGNAMVCLLLELLLNIVSYMIVLGLDKHHIYEPGSLVAWSVCMLITAGLLLALIIFNGRKAYTEIQKRLSV